jgi:hypothetical protein
MAILDVKCTVAAEEEGNVAFSEGTAQNHMLIN